MNKEEKGVKNGKEEEGERGESRGGIRGKAGMMQKEAREGEEVEGRRRVKEGWEGERGGEGRKE